MKVNVEVIYNETIKPSSPTPHYLRHYKLSFLDQISPPVFMPLVLFYPKEDCTNLTNLEQSIRIKKSLSEALTRFYPLAGRVKDNLYIFIYYYTYIFKKLGYGYGGIIFYYIFLYIIIHIFLNICKLKNKY